MSVYQVVFRDRSVELVEGADAYRQEGQLTTFFRTAPGRAVVDSWSTRLASFRTSTVAAVRRLENASTNGTTSAPQRGPSAAALRLMSGAKHGAAQGHHGVEDDEEEEEAVPAVPGWTGKKSSASCS